MTEAVYDVYNVIMIRVLVLLTCTYTGNSENGVYFVIVMVLFV